PSNGCDPHYRSFERQVAPVCLEQGTAVLGMKSLGGSPDGQNGRLVKAGLATAEECLRYALSQPVSSLVVGLRNQRDLDQAIAVARGFKPMSREAQTALRGRVEAEAGDGRHELFKSSKQFDSPHHRKQHGFALEGT